MPESRVAISLGSNQGDSCENIRRAAEALRSQGVENLVLSPLYQTSPVDCPEGAPDFVNAALAGTTKLSAMDLLAVCRAVEDNMGRPRTRGYHEDRVIDVLPQCLDVGSCPVRSLGDPARGFAEGRQPPVRD